MSRVPLIALVDDDAAVREALTDLIEVFDLECRAFESGESFLAAHVPYLFDCLVSDLNLTGLSGLQLRDRLAILEPDLPVIIISAHADARDQAMRCGALAFLPKPVNDQTLHRHLMWALGRGPAPE